MATPPAPLIDILSSQSYATEHIPGAINLCVFETAFLDKVRETYPDTTTPLRLYGFCDTTEEVATAISKLRSAGYTDVTALPGGLEKWKADGGEVAGNGLPSTPRSGRLALDTSASFIRWTGTNLMSFHNGRIALKGGELLVKDGELKSGVIRIDMESMSCADLEDQSLNAMLIHHLRSSDFFSVDEFPSAEFSITSCRDIDGATPGLPNFDISGDLRLRGNTVPMKFSAVVAEIEGGSFAAHGFCHFDRTLWGSIYGSGKFFSRMGMHLVDDMVQIHIHVTARPIND